jgi:fermentation-respiration switch protein FrsA (DUF1100 family)
MKDTLMKKIKYIIPLSTFLFIIPVQSLISQSNEKIKGNWLGTLRAQGLELRVVFRVSENEDGTLKATLDSPDQGAFDIPVDSAIYDEPNVRFVVKAAAGFYEGEFEGDSIVGTWTQSISLPLTLKRTENVEQPKRPQEPKPPFPYNEEDVSLENSEDALTLSGTFTFPKEGNLFPTVILVSGSGPQDRNEELLGHKPFLVLADYLTRNGIAVLRFDDRGVGKSSGNFSTATTEDFVTDVLAGVEYLKTRREVDKDKIGLIGHSEGGLIAPLAAVQSDDIDFIILMAAPGMPGKEILGQQTALIMRANGYEEEKIKRDVNVLSKMYDIIVNEKDTSAAKEKLRVEFDKSYMDLTDEEKKAMGDPDLFFNQRINSLLSPWFRFFLGYDPYKTLTKIKIPLLAITGEKDLQVPPKENLELIEKALKEGGNKNYRVAELKGLNHLFQEAETGSPNEYAKIEETISRIALTYITDWIKKITE